MPKLANCINKWIKKSSNEFKCDSIFEGDYAIQYDDAIALCEAIRTLETQNKDIISKSIKRIMYCLQEESIDEKVYDILNDGALPLLISLFKSYELDSDAKIFLLKLCVLYSNPEGHTFIIDALKANYGSKEYLWDIIFDIISRDKELCQYIVNNLESFIPSAFCGITYLDMCNRAMHSGFLQEHPFNSEQGIKFIKDMYSLKDLQENYKTSIAGVIPFLNELNYQKIESIIDKDVKSFTELEEFILKKEKEIERILGNHTTEGLILIIPYDENFPIYLYPNSPYGTAFSTLDLSNLGRAPQPNQYGTFELVMFTKIKTNEEIDIIKDRIINKIQMRFRSTLNAVGSYSFDAILKPHDTITIPDDEEIHLVMEKLENSDFIVDQIPHHLLVLIEIFESELNYARKNGSIELIKKLKQKDYYPYSDMDREPVA